MAKKSTKKVSRAPAAKKAANKRSKPVLNKPKPAAKKAKTIAKKSRGSSKRTPLQKKVAKAPPAKKTAKVTTKVAPKPPKPAPAPRAAIPAAEPPAPKAPACPAGYTPDEYTKYKSEKQRLKDFGNKELKEMLKKNLQSMSGNKDQLIEKIADGIVLGRIPRCPNCFGGRPKYDYKTGKYHCSGYRDDEDFKNCHTDFTKEDLKRDPWEA